MPSQFTTNEEIGKYVSWLNKIVIKLHLSAKNLHHSGYLYYLVVFFAHIEFGLHSCLKTKMHILLHQISAILPLIRLWYWQCQHKCRPAHHIQPSSVQPIKARTPCPRELSVFAHRGTPLPPGSQKLQEVEQHSVAALLKRKLSLFLLAWHQFGSRT